MVSKTISDQHTQASSGDIAEPGPQKACLKLSAGPCSLSDFKLQRVIGQGSYGKVYLAEHRGSQRQYAVKVLRKAALIQRNMLQNTVTERKILVSFVAFTCMWL